jgi:hypothetical protein
MSQFRMILVLSVVFLSLTTVAKGEDLVYSLDPKQGSYDVTIKFIRQEMKRENFEKVSKITLTTGYVVIELEHRTHCFIRETVQSIKWKIRKANGEADVETIKKKPEVLKENLKETIASCIKMLNNKDYLGFIKRFCHPEDLAKITKKNVTIEQLATGFGVKKAVELEALLQKCLTIKPELDATGKFATFQVEGSRAIKFVKAGGSWYLRN